jgi:hypothetical protein
MTAWVRFERGGSTALGTVDGGVVHLHEGDLFTGARPTGETVQLEGRAVEAR